MINLYGIKIVNLRDRPRPSYDLYMGRGNRRMGLPDSKWANPFPLEKESDRDEVYAKYKAYVLSRPDLIAALPELRNKVLSCWCYPKRCHVMALVEIMEEIGIESD